MVNRLYSKSVNSLLIFQVVSVAVTVLIVWPLYGYWVAYSLGLGGLVSFIPNWVFSLLVFRHYGAQAAKRIVMDFYLGECLKIVVAVMLFIIVFHFLDVTPFAFFAGFILVQLSFWFAPLLMG